MTKLSWSEWTWTIWRILGKGWQEAKWKQTHKSFRTQSFLTIHLPWKMPGNTTSNSVSPSFCNSWFKDVLYLLGVPKWPGQICSIYTFIHPFRWHLAFVAVVNASLHCLYFYFPHYRCVLLLHNHDLKGLRGRHTSHTSRLWLCDLTFISLMASL